MDTVMDTYTFTKIRRLTTVADLDSFIVDNVLAHTKHVGGHLASFGMEFTSATLAKMFTTEHDKDGYADGVVLATNSNGQLVSMHKIFTKGTDIKAGCWINNRTALNWGTDTDYWRQYFAFLSSEGYEYYHSLLIPSLVDFVVNVVVANNSYNIDGRNLIVTL